MFHRESFCLVCDIFLPSEKKKKGSAFRNKPSTEQLGEDFVIQHLFIRDLVEQGTTLAAVVRQGFAH